MLEANCLINLMGEAFYFNTPRYSSVFIPDDDDSWDMIWNNKDILLGDAHSHPGHGQPGPSFIDLKTYDGVELAIGKRIKHWIINADNVIEIIWVGPNRYDYDWKNVSEQNFAWIDELRKLSEYYLPEFTCPSE